jgi:cysteine desulfurase
VKTKAPDRYYFDHNATTPVSTEVLDVYTGLLKSNFGNASSIHHYGQEAKNRLDRARKQVAWLIGADQKHIVFMSGGTEANNLGILGPLRDQGVTGRHVITTEIEHPAVLNACVQAEREGADVTYLEVGSSGAVEPDQVRRALRPETSLVSVMHVNNETGVIQPVEEIGEIAREAEVPFHCDGVQAAGKLQLDREPPPADYYTLSAHKFYAPKGVGAIYVRPGAPIEGITYGGHQERDLRPGTQNVPGASAMGVAAKWARKHAPKESARLGELRDLLEQSVLDRIPGTAVNGSGRRVGNTSSIRFDGVGAEALLIALDLKGFAAATGSACSSGSIEPSHVLMGMGLTRAQAKSSLRFSLGASNNREQIEALVEALAKAVSQFRPNELLPIMTP